MLAAMRVDRYNECTALLASNTEQQIIILQILLRQVISVTSRSVTLLSSQLFNLLRDISCCCCYFDNVKSEIALQEAYSIRDYDCLVIVFNFHNPSILYQYFKRSLFPAAT